MQDEIGASGIEDALDGVTLPKLDEAVAGVAVNFGVNDAPETPKEVAQLPPGIIRNEEIFRTIFLVEFEPFARQGVKLALNSDTRKPRFYTSFNTKRNFKLFYNLLYCFILIQNPIAISIKLHRPWKPNLTTLFKSLFDKLNLGKAQSDVH